MTKSEWIVLSAFVCGYVVALGQCLLTDWLRSRRER